MIGKATGLRLQIGAPMAAGDESGGTVVLDELDQGHKGGHARRRSVLSPGEIIGMERSRAQVKKTVGVGD
jgi:hypothetical protein